MLNFALRIKKNIPYLVSIFVFVNILNFIESYYFKEKFIISDSLYHSISPSIWTFLIYLIFIKEDSKLSLKNILKTGFLGAFLGLFGFWIKNKTDRKNFKK